MLSACAGRYNHIEVQENIIRNDGIYEINRLSPEWEWHPGMLKGRSRNSVDAHDIWFKRCPGPQTVTIIRAIYEPPLLIFGDTDVDQTVKEMLNYLNETYDTMTPKPKNRELISHRRLILNNYDTAESVFLTTEEFPTSCETPRSISREIKSKFVLIKRGAWLKPLWKYDSPNLIVLWYASPEDQYDDSVNEFDQMVQSFRLLSLD